jgi:hypothetical protein
VTHGYFLPYRSGLRGRRTGERGDPSLSRAARLAWRRLGLTSPGRYDGVSIVDRGTHTDTFVVYRDLFTGKTGVLALRGAS